MELHDLIESIRDGNDRAFGRLVANYRDMAFGYAMTLLHQEQAAEDAVQEALVLAYTHIDDLRDPQAFGAWLRGIVRHQCFRALRSRANTVPLDVCAYAGVGQSDPVLLTQHRVLQEQIIAEISRLSPGQQEILKLFYDVGLSQKQIATQLNLSVAAVNMRLHTARQRLKRRLNMETGSSVPNVGHIQEAQGIVVTVQFAPKSTPPIFSLLLANGNESLCVVQHLGAGRVRAIPASDSRIWTAGQEIVDTGTPFTAFLPNAAIQPAIDVLRNHTNATDVMATGIKAVDVFAPLTVGGNTGIFTEMGLGVLVLLPEILRRLDKPESRQTFFAFLPPVRDTVQWREIVAEITPGNPNIAMIYLPVEDPTRREFAEQLQHLDAVLVLSRSLAEQSIWPCLDPRQCRSIRLTATRHKRTAGAINELLNTYYRLQFCAPTEGNHVLSPDEWTQVRRARKVLRFLSQPFFVAEPYTGKQGVSVSPDEGLEGFAAILAGRHDNTPADAFYMTGAAPTAG